MRMKYFRLHSFDSVVLFTLYVCVADGVRCDKKMEASIQFNDRLLMVARGCELCVCVCVGGFVCERVQARYEYAQNSINCAQ